MPPSQKSDSTIKCNLLWKLCRRHGWSTPIPRDDLVIAALESSEQGRGKRLVAELLTEPDISYQRNRGYRIRNSPDAQAYAAFRLRESCGYSTLQIESTLSRFKQAGGFDVYDRETVFPASTNW